MQHLIFHIILNNSYKICLFKSYFLILLLDKIQHLIWNIAYFYIISDMHLMVIYYILNDKLKIE